jgi:hypothetical protein
MSAHGVDKAAGGGRERAGSPGVEADEPPKVTESSIPLRIDLRISVSPRAAWTASGFVAGVTTIEMVTHGVRMIMGG